MVGSYYRKTKPETQKKNREENIKLYSPERKWLGDNLELLKGSSISVNGACLTAIQAKKNIFSTFSGHSINVILSRISSKKSIT